MSKIASSKFVHPHSHKLESVPVSSHSNLHVTKVPKIPLTSTPNNTPNMTPIQNVKWITPSFQLGTAKQ